MFLFDRAILIVFGYYFPVLLPGCSGSRVTCYQCKWLTGESRFWNDRKCSGEHWRIQGGGRGPWTPKVKFWIRQCWWGR